MEPEIVSCLARRLVTIPTMLSQRPNCQGKGIPLQDWTTPEISRKLRIPDFKTIGTWRWYGCQPYAPAAFTPLTPQEYSWYSFLLKAESTSGPQCGRKDYVKEKFQWYHREPNRIVAQCLNQLRHHVRTLELYSHYWIAMHLWYILFVRIRT